MQHMHGSQHAVHGAFPCTSEQNLLCEATYFQYTVIYVVKHTCFLSVVCNVVKITVDTCLKKVTPELD